MKIRHIYNSKLAKLINVEAIMLYPFIFYEDKQPSQILKKHEMIHVMQLRKIGFFSFYLSYVLYYLAGLLLYKNSYYSYRNIPYEKEAFENQNFISMFDEK